MGTEFILLLCLIFVFIGSSNTSDYKRVCYVINWGQYREGTRKFTAANIYEPYLCTHYILAFAKVLPDTDSIGPTDNNDEGANGNYAQLVDIKKRYPGIKVLLAVGGWTHGSEPFSEVVSKDIRVYRFCDNVIRFLRARGFDGLDLDWEYPAHRGSNDTDRERFTFFVQTLMRRFTEEAETSGKPRLLLTAAVPTSASMVTKGYEVGKLANSLDFVNLMAYDYDLGREYLVYLAPLYPRPEDKPPNDKLNVNAGVKFWISQGMPKDKVVLGIPIYGRQSTVNDSSYVYGEETAFNTTKTPVNQDVICKNLRNGWTTKYDNVSKVAVMYTGDSWINYEDLRSIEAKGNYIKEEKLGGGMVWELAAADFHGTECGNGRYPLLSKLREILPSPTPAPPLQTSTPGTETTPSTTPEPRNTCQPGTYFDEQTISCITCPVGEYQDQSGQSRCKECPGEMTTRQQGTNSIDLCSSPCQTGNIPCGENGVCRWDDEKLSASCRCLSNYRGDRCNIYIQPKDEEVNIPLIIGASVGGALGLAAIILLICGCILCYRYKMQEKRTVRQPNTSPGTIPVDFQDYIDFRLWKHNVGTETVFGTRIPPSGRRNSSRLNYTDS